mgnify:CR=1 FL=1
MHQEKLFLLRFMVGILPTPVPMADGGKGVDTPSRMDNSANLHFVDAEDWLPTPVPRSKPGRMR